MKKTIVISIVVMLFISCIISVHADEDVKEMVYAPPSVQEEVYQKFNDKEYTVRKLRRILSKVSSMAWRNLEFPKSFQKFAEILKKIDFEKK